MKQEIKVGDAVILRDVIQPLDGKTGEVVKVLPDDWYKVRVAVIFPDGTPYLYTMEVKGSHLEIDQVVNEKIRNGGGVINR